MLKIKKIDHVAICVADGHAAEAVQARFRAAFGLVAGTREMVASQKTEATRIPVGADGTCLELIVPRGNEGLARFLDKRGPGLHHVAVEVEGIESAIAFLESIGVEMIDHAPRVGAGGHKVAFVHPRSMGGVLVELVEHA